MVCWAACGIAENGEGRRWEKQAWQRLEGRRKRVIPKHSLACCSRSPEGMLVVHEVVCPGATESGLGACRMGYHAGRRRRSPWKGEQPEAGHEWCRITLITEAAAQKLSCLESVMLHRDKMSLGDCGAAVWCLKFDGCPDPDLPWQVR